MKCFYNCLQTNWASSVQVDMVLHILSGILHSAPAESRAKHSLTLSAWWRSAGGKTNESCEEGNLQVAGAFFIVQGALIKLCDKRLFFSCSVTAHTISNNFFCVKINEKHMRQVWYKRHWMHKKLFSQNDKASDKNKKIAALYLVHPCSSLFFVTKWSCKEKLCKERQCYENTHSETTSVAEELHELWSCPSAFQTTTSTINCPILHLTNL